MIETYVIDIYIIFDYTRTTVSALSLYSFINLIFEALFNFNFNYKFDEF